MALVCLARWLVGDGAILAGGEKMEGERFVQRTREKLWRDLGELVATALQHPQTIEVALNPDGKLWAERIGEPMKCIGTMEPFHAEAVIKTLASHLHEVVTRSTPILEGELPPDGWRFSGQLPPVVKAPAFAIRVPAMRVIALEEYVACGELSQARYEVLKAAIERRENILVVGGTGSGKTTLVNALIGAMVRASPNDRVIVIEDTQEIQCAAQNSIQYRTCPGVSVTDLLKASLRMRPDRILVGEVRGPEALDLLMAWNTGHEGGAATVHANDARSGLSRLERLVSMHSSSPRQVPRLIAEVVDVVVHIARVAGGRAVQEVLRVDGWCGDDYQTTQC